MSPEVDRFTLQIPPDPAYVATARMFAATLARHFEIPDESIEDLKLAISEACSRSLAGDEGAGIAMTIERRTDRLIFEIEQSDLGPERASVDTPTPSAHQLASGLSLELVSALFEDAAVVSEGDRPVLRFSIGA